MQRSYSCMINYGQFFLFFFQIRVLDLAILADTRQALGHLHTLSASGYQRYKDVERGSGLISFTTLLGCLNSLTSMIF
jgi:hypothetical protein